MLVACLQDPERQKECEELLGPVGDDKFTYLKDVGRLITDFSQPDEEPGAPGDTLDDDIGVAVEFEGDEDADEESEVDEVEVCCSCRSAARQYVVLDLVQHPGHCLGFAMFSCKARVKVQSL